MLNYFEIFAIENNYDIDKDYLEKKYLELQLAYHPDRTSSNNDTDKEAQNLFQNSEIINKAYNILKDDLFRAEYLLSLNGINLNQDSKDAVKPDQNILLESLKQREYLEKLSDIISVEDYSREIKLLIKQVINELYKEFKYKEFKLMNIQNIVSIIIKLKYLYKLNIIIKEKILKLSQSSN